MPTYEPLNSTDQEISQLIRARYPILTIVTYEERRVLAQLEGVRQDLIERRQAHLQQQFERARTEEERRIPQEQMKRLDHAHQILRWSCTGGLIHWSHYEKTPDGTLRHAPRPLPLNVKDTANPVEVLSYLRNHPRDVVDGVDLSTALLVFCDLHPWLDREDRGGRFNNLLVRTLRDLVHLFKFSPEPRSILLLSPRPVIPLELSKDIQVLDYPLPTVEQLERRFHAREAEMKQAYGEDCIRLDGAALKELMRALSGLTYDEAENVLAKSLANNGYLHAEDVAEALREKRQIIEKDGTLEYFENEKDFSQVGGLDRLRAWLDRRRLAFTGQKLQYNGQEIELPVPKGILLIGVPGGGKSLMAKAVARAWGLPLLRLDIGRIFGGIVGQSEENMRRAIRVAESVAPAVIWLDEVEKAFPKTSASTDSGVSLRVMNTFLTWMQEKQAPVFVVATGNDIGQVPPELTRKGRFDEIFYVGLPDQAARRQIFEIHTRGLFLSREVLDQLAKDTRWYTGAEIEQIVKNAVYELPAFLDSHGRREEGAADGSAHSDPLYRAITHCLSDFVPLARRKDPNDPNDRGLLATLLAKARLMAIPAGTFEELRTYTAEGETAYAEQVGERRF
jgi:ATPase family protein associated with various cellular activities (AAA)